MITRKKWTVLILASYMILLPVFVWATSTIDLPKTGLTTSYATGDDAAVQAGVAWPSPRFADNGDETVTDNLTGLIWTKYAGTPGPEECGPGIGMRWKRAFDHIACLNTNNYLGHADWRLPNINELGSLIDLSQSNPALPVGHPFTNLQSDRFCVFDTSILCTDKTANPQNRFWSSTTSSLSSSAWVGYLGTGAIWDDDKTGGYFNYVLPVRGECGTTGSICLPKTGQTTRYASGDDGNLQTGTIWPSPRFTKSKKTVTDNLTGLIWIRNYGDAPQTCGQYEKNKTWQAALDHMTCLNTNNYRGCNDWKLPNRIELLSLINRSKNAPGLPFDVPFDYCWSSSTVSADSNEAWITKMDRGDATAGNKADGYCYMPVRSGEACSCSYSISQSDESFTVSGGKDSIIFTASADTCEWTAESSDPWIKIISKKSGKGNAIIKYSISANTITSPRTGTISIGGRTFTVTQDEARPKIAASSSIAFGKIEPKNKSAAKTINVKNSGQAPLIIGTVSVTDDNNIFSIIKDNCSGKTLAKAKSCTIRVKFSAEAAGTYSGDLIIPSNDPDTPTTSVELSGGI